MKNTKGQLFRVGHMEGVSFLLLLFIAMPLKYVFNMPVAVRIAGGLHGVLFVAFIAVLTIAWRRMSLTYSQVAKAFLLSFLPCGTFFLHRIIK